VSACPRTPRLLPSTYYQGAPCNAKSHVTSVAASIQICLPNPLSPSLSSYAFFDAFQPSICENYNNEADLDFYSDSIDIHCTLPSVLLPGRYQSFSSSLDAHQHTCRCSHPRPTVSAPRSAPGRVRILYSSTRIATQGLPTTTCVCTLDTMDSSTHLVQLLVHTR